MEIAKNANYHDQFAVPLSVPEIGIVGHVPREFSCVVRHFLSPVDQEVLCSSMDIFLVHWPEIDYGEFVLFWVAFLMLPLRVQPC